MLASRRSARSTSPSPIRLGQLEHAALARLGDQLLDVLEPDALALANVKGQLLERLAQAAEIGPGDFGQRRRRVGVERDLALARLAREPAAELAIAQRREVVEEASLAHGRERP